MVPIIPAVAQLNQSRKSNVENTLWNPNDVAVTQHHKRQPEVAQNLGSELIFVFRNGKEQHRNNVQLGRFGRNRTNVWNYAGANSVPRKGRKRDSDSGNLPRLHFSGGVMIGRVFTDLPGRTRLQAA
jgi:hypothetical protein